MKTAPICLAIYAIFSSLPVIASRPIERESDGLPYQYIYIAELSKLRHEAELGKPESQFQLGIMYYDPPDGSGIPQSYRRAFLLFFEASLRGHVTAQHNVGAMYWNGDYVSQNLIEGYAWLLLAAENGDSTAKRKVAQHFDDLLSEQRLQADKRLAELKVLVAKAVRLKDFEPRHFGIH